MNDVTAHPFIKSAGGKRKLAPRILELLPKKIETYHEPFVGGGAVFFALAAEKRFGAYRINDINPELPNAYLAIHKNWRRVVEELQSHVYEKSHYLKVRAQDPDTLDRFQRAARFIYLNKTCFNGLWRVNKKGQFNVPFGRYDNPTICDEENLRAVSEEIKRSEGLILESDFEFTLHEAREGDAVYCDPPYYPTSTSANFTAYDKSGFGPKEQERLRDVAEALAKRGVHVLLSNSDTPFIRKLYRGFKIEYIEAARNVNSVAEKRGKVKELLISWKQ